jgi:hypothetical protein
MTYNRRTVSIITAPASLPVSVADAKLFLNLEGTADDALVEAFIYAAADAVRQYCKRSLVAETLELRMDGFPQYSLDRLDRLGPGVHMVSIPHEEGAPNVIDLPFGPVASITSITSYARDNSSAVFSSANYGFDVGRVYLNEGSTWPSDLRRIDAVAIRYVSGTSPIPYAILQAIKIHVAAMYECREGCEMPMVCKAMLGPYRRLDQMGFS